MRPALEVADIVRAHGDEFRRAHATSLSPRQKRALRNIELCRTAALGGHLERCDQCGHERNAYNSCADRHCPKCHSLARAKWLEKRRAELLPVEYFHVVFTLPEPLAQFSLQNKQEIYNLLFRATAETLLTIAADPQHLGAQIGFFCILHSWGQTLTAHPHLHCVVPGGGISQDGTRWVAAVPPSSYLSRFCRGASEKSISVICSKPMRAGSFSFTATSSPWPILRTSLGG